MAPMIAIIPAIIFSLLLAFVYFSKPMYFAKKVDGKRVIQWKRTIILTVILTVVLSGAVFVFFPEVLMM